MEEEVSLIWELFYLVQAIFDWMENLPSSLAMRDIEGYIDHVQVVKQNLRRLHSGSVEQRILNRIIYGLDEMRYYLEET